MHAAAVDRSHPTRRRRVWLWAAAFVVTSALAAFQRFTGPTYPVRGHADVAGVTVSYRLPRAHAGDTDLRVAVEAPAALDGILEWRRWPTDDPWTAVDLERDGGRLTTVVPHQPAGGKVEYRLILRSSGVIAGVVPADESVVARFRTSVPAALLLPHVLAMFVSMLLATRVVLEVVTTAGGRPRRLVLAAMALLVVGGLVLGPLVQRAAFGALWTGWPYGTDLTDNKTAIAVLAWLPATVVAWRGRRQLRWPVVIGWVVMMGVFLIPHSMRGTQIDWQEHERVSSARSVDPTSLLSWSGCPATTRWRLVL